MPVTWQISCWTNVIRDYSIYTCFESTSLISASFSSHTFKLGLFQGRDVLKYHKRPTLAPFNLCNKKQATSPSNPSSQSMSPHPQINTYPHASSRVFPSESHTTTNPKCINNKDNHSALYTSSIDQFQKRKPSAWSSYDIMMLQNSHHLVTHNYSSSFYSGSLPPIFHGKNYKHVNPLPTLKLKTKPLYSINKHLWQCQQGIWE